VPATADRNNRFADAEAQRTGKKREEILTGFRMMEVIIFDTTKMVAPRRDRPSKSAAAEPVYIYLV
jgi:hypothetical protein